MSYSLTFVLFALSVLPLNSLLSCSFQVSNRGLVKRVLVALPYCHYLSTSVYAAFLADLKSISSDWFSVESAYATSLLHIPAREVAPTPVGLSTILGDVLIVRA